LPCSRLSQLYRYPSRKPAHCALRAICDALPPPAQGSILARQRIPNNAFFRLFNHTYPPEQQMLHQGF